MNFPSGKRLFYLITPGNLPKGPDETAVIDIIRLAVDLEIPLVQIREKALTTLELCRFAEKVVAITNGSQTRLLINDRADVAAAVGADGVHLTTRSMPAKIVRAAFPDLLVGVSTHNEPEIAEAVSGNADFAVFGPVFESPGKAVATGLGGLQKACAAFPGFPILGLGGIDERNVEEVFGAGAAGVAAIRMLNDPITLRSLIRRR